MICTRQTSNWHARATGGQGYGEVGRFGTLPASSRTDPNFMAYMPSGRTTYSCRNAMAGSIRADFRAGK